MSIRFSILTAITLFLLPMPLLAAELASHRAIYSIRMDRTQVGSGVVGVGGAATFVVEKTCDGWITTQRLSMVINTADGRDLRQEINYSVWESLNGKRFRFAVRDMSSGKKDDINGRAWTATDRPGEAVFTSPEAKTISLPKGTMFPNAYMSWIIDRASGGDRQVQKTLFEGADGSGPRNVVAFIGPAIGPEKISQAAQDAGLGGPGWKMRLAYFPLSSRDSTPEYEIDVVQLKNGVISKMGLDYKTFSAILKLEKIESIPVPSC